MSAFDAADEIYSILVSVGGAHECYRRDFQYGHRNILTDRSSEWRFQGHFGFGGKFRNYGDRWYVDYYAEDFTEELNALLVVINEKLATLKETTDAPKTRTDEEIAKA